MEEPPRTSENAEADSGAAEAIAQIARQYQQLLNQGTTWAGGPITGATLERAATAAVDALNLVPMLQYLAEGPNPARELRQTLAIVWAQGFNVGAMHTAQEQDRRR